MAGIRSVGGRVYRGLGRVEGFTGHLCGREIEGESMRMAAMRLRMAAMRLVGGRFYRGWNHPKIVGDLASKVVKAVTSYKPPKGWNWRNPYFAANYYYCTTTTTGQFSCTTATASSLKKLQSDSVMPLLMIPPSVKWALLGDEADQHMKDEDKDYYHFYNDDREEVTSTRKRPIPGLPDDTPWIGSCHGWVIFMNPTNLSLYLVNPFHDYDYDVEAAGDDQSVVFNKPYYVPLPPLDNSLMISSTKHDDGMIFIKKLAMSAAPYDDNCKMLAVIGPSGDLAFCNPRENDAKWTPLKGLVKVDDSYQYNDVIYSSQDKLFYAIGGNLNDAFDFEAWDLNGAHPQGTLIRPRTLNHPLTRSGGKFFEVNGIEIERRYLVELAGDIYLFARHICEEVDEDGRFFLKTWLEDDDDTPKYTKEEVDEYKRALAESTYLTHFMMQFKLDRVRNEWYHMDRFSDLGNYAVFVGRNHSFSRSSSDCHEVEPWGHYYTDDSIDHEMKTNSQLWGGHDCGLNRYEIPFLPRSLLKRIQPPPIWVNNAPSLFI